MQREQNSADRREYKLKLTAFGRKTIKEIRAALGKCKPIYVRELSETELRDANRLLSRAIGHPRVRRTSEIFDSGIGDAKAGQLAQEVVDSKNIEVG